MFPTSFSFAAALLALPIAGAPILLHLLYRQKSPVVPFSTLRFIKLSVRQTAARRKVQKWLLLATRALLIALLIWAIAQPVHQLTSNWSGGTGRSLVAAVVIDTSYSMQMKQGQVTQLSKAESIVQDLLREQLAGGKVAIFTSRADPLTREQAKDPSALLAGWTPLEPEGESRPMIDRIGSALSFLGRQTADSKWLIVLTDFQSAEFPNAIPDLPGGRVILFDLHTTEPKSAGITGLSISPSQPIPGVPGEISVQATGQPGDSRTVTMSVDAPDGRPLVQSAEHVQVTLDSAGKATARFPVRLPAQRWLLITGAFTAGDDMAWDDSRTQLIEVPPKQTVGLLRQNPNSLAEKIVGYALDPLEPTDPGHDDWPLAIRAEVSPTSNDDAAVAVLSRWPDANQAATLQNFVAQGHNLVLFLTPGLESSWAILPPAEQKSLLDLLPSAPENRAAVGPWHATFSNKDDPLLSGLTDEKFQLSAVTVRQIVTMSAAGNSTAILNAVAIDPDTGSRPRGLLFRKPSGRGICYTVATTPDGVATNFATEPTFLPLLVKMVLPNPGQSTAQNVDLGTELKLPAGKFPGVDQLQITTPRNEPYKVDLSKTGEFIFNAKPTEPGIYIWTKPGDPKPVAMTNVQRPAAESDPNFKPVAAVVPPGPNTVVATSIAELNAHIKDLATPQPQWSLPLAIVLLLLCAEAMMGSWTRLWKRPGTTAVAVA